MKRSKRVLTDLALVILGAFVVLVAATIWSKATMAQSPGIHIVGATSVSPLQLSRGCNQVVTDSPNGASVAGIASLVSPPTALVSIWRFNNGTHGYQAGFFADRSAPVDFSSTGTGNAGRSTEGYFICVSQAATLISG